MLSYGGLVAAYVIPGYVEAGGGGWEGMALAGVFPSLHPRAESRGVSGIAEHY